MLTIPTWPYLWYSLAESTVARASSSSCTAVASSVLLSTAVACSQDKNISKVWKVDRFEKDF